MSRILPLPRWAVLTGRNAELLAYLRRVEHVRNSQRPPTFSVPRVHRTTPKL
jgi:hypothetical protein